MPWCFPLLKKGLGELELVALRTYEPPVSKLCCVGVGGGFARGVTAGKEVISVRFWCVIEPAGVSGFSRVFMGQLIKRSFDFCNGNIGIGVNVKQSQIELPWKK